MERVDSNLLEPSPWSTIPEVYDPYTFDLAHYTHLLRNNSKRLFTQDDQLWVKVIEVGERGL
jgi:hypothetical protein